MLLVVQIAPANAETAYTFQDGNKLYEFCTSKNDGKLAICIGYVEGAADALEGFRSMQGMPQCVRNGVTGRQLIDVAIRYWRDHPERRDYAAATSVISAVSDAFCPENPTAQ